MPWSRSSLVERGTPTGKWKESKVVEAPVESGWEEREMKFTSSSSIWLVSAPAEAKLIYTFLLSLVYSVCRLSGSCHCWADWHSPSINNQLYKNRRLILLRRPRMSFPSAPYWHLTWEFQRPQLRKQTKSIQLHEVNFNLFKFRK